MHNVLLNRLVRDNWKRQRKRFRRVGYVLLALALLSSAGTVIAVLFAAQFGEQAASSFLAAALLAFLFSFVFFLASGKQRNNQQVDVSIGAGGAEGWIPGPEFDPCDLGIGGGDCGGGE